MVSRPLISQFLASSMYSYLLAGRAPKTVKLFINQPQALDFDAAEQRKPVQEFVYVTNSVLGPIMIVMFYTNLSRLTEDDVGEESVIQLHYVKYQNVQNITVSMTQIST